MKRTATAGLLLATAFLNACAGRDAHPISAVQAYDTSLACDQMQAEMAQNEVKVSQLVKEKRGSEASNVAVGVVGVLLFWPALFALDLSDAESVEMVALRRRNQRLADLHGRQCLPNVQASARPVPLVHPASVPASHAVASPVPVTVTTTTAAWKEAPDGAPVATMQTAVRNP